MARWSTDNDPITSAFDLCQHGATVTCDCSAPRMTLRFGFEFLLRALALLALRAIRMSARIGSLARPAALSQSPSGPSPASKDASGATVGGRPTGRPGRSGFGSGRAGTRESMDGTVPLRAVP
jgi:hypothetical protein